jgi:hypothetical protein
MIQQQDAALSHATIADENGNHQINFQQGTGVVISQDIKTFFLGPTVDTGKLRGG